MQAQLSDLSARKQVALLRPLVTDLLHHYSLAGAEIHLLLHSFNTTFKIVHQGRKFALRVNMNSFHDHAAVLAEVQWLVQLRAQGFPAASPVAGIDGSFVTQVQIPGFEKIHDAVLFEWLPGSVVADAPSNSKWFEAGRLMAELHQISKDWSPAAPARFPMVDDALMASDFNLPTTNNQSISDQLREAATAQISQSTHALANFGKNHALQPIHTDMHGHNIMSNRGRLTVFDFDDSGLGHAVQDLANAIFYIRDEPTFEEALLAGYSSVGPLPNFAEADFEGLLVSRTILLLNDLLTSSNAELYGLIPEYSKKVLWRIQNYRDTGRFLLSAQ